MSDTDTDILLTDEDLAKRWKCSTRTLSNYRKKGRVPPFFTVGGSRRYRQADVKAFEAKLIEEHS